MNPGGGVARMADGGRFAPYVAELREFFASREMRFGAPEDLAAFAQALRGPGAFREELASLTRSVVYREQGTIAITELLELMTVAMGGARIAEAGEAVREPVRELLGFLGKAMRGGRAEALDDVAAGDVARDAGPVAVAGVVDRPGAGGEAVGGVHPHAATEFYSRAWSISRGAENGALASESLGSEVVGPAIMGPEIKRQEVMSEGGSDAQVSGVERAAAPELSSAVSGDVNRRRSDDLNRRRTDGANRRRTDEAKRRRTDDAKSDDAKRRGSGVRWGWFGMAAVAGLAVAGVVMMHPWARPAAGPVGEPTVTTVRPAEGVAGGSSDAGTGIRGGETDRVDVRGTTAAVSGDGAGSGVDAMAVQPDASGPAVRAKPAAGEPMPPAAASGTSGGATPLSPSMGSLPPRRTGVYTVSSGVMAANLISAPEPAYPKLARLIHMKGPVIMQAVVSRDGKVVATHVLRGHRLLRGAASNAVRQWRYQPYLVNGRPAEVATIVTVNFRQR